MCWKSQYVQFWLSTQLGVLNLSRDAPYMQCTLKMYFPEKSQIIIFYPLNSSTLLRRGNWEHTKAESGLVFERCDQLPRFCYYTHTKTNTKTIVLLQKIVILKPSKTTSQSICKTLEMRRKPNKMRAVFIHFKHIGAESFLKLLL